MPELFRRSWAVQVGTIRIEGIGAGNGAERTGLDVMFDIESSTRREPNTASVKIWNLSSEHRRYISTASTLVLSVEAGFHGSRQVLFSGDISAAASRRRQALHRSVSSSLGSAGSKTDDVDIVTELEASDGGTAWRTARVSRSFGTGTTVADVLTACVDAMGIGQGNLPELRVGAAMRGGDILTFGEGTVLSGPAHRELDRIVRSAGLTWSVQNNALQLKQHGRTLATRAVMLSPETGLEGSPEVGADGYVTALSLLNGALSPGRPVVLESRESSGSFSVRRTKHYGDTAAADWNTEVVLEAR